MQLASTVADDSSLSSAVATRSAREYVLRVALPTGLVAAALLVPALVLAGCNSCQSRSRPRERRAALAPAECTGAEDCVDLEPCREVDCIDSRCRERLLPAGTPCGEASACQSEPTCDDRGECVAGQPLGIDDGNPCTVDSCDPTRGAIHDPVAIDDGDACTTDACEPNTGEITHEPVDLDDGDECTFDTCNPQTGVQHARADPKYTCAADCGPGYHVASRRRNPACPGLQSSCLPVCGPSFYTCENTCPAGYRAGAHHLTEQCGPDQPLTFCSREAR